MRAKVKSATRQASKLHGASAHFVSLVDRGANETPFTLIKSANGAKIMSIKKRNKSRKSHKKVNSPKVAKSDDTVVTTETIIAKMVFDSDVFETEQEVRDYLEKAEWETDAEIKIEADENENWVASEDGVTDDDFSRIAKVEIDEEGVEAYVGERSVEDAADDDDEDDPDAVAKSDEEDEDEDGDEEDDDADDDDEPESAAKAKKKPYKKAAPVKLSKRQQFLAKAKDEREKAKKFDSWDARMGKENTLAATVKAGMSWDGVPPGYYEVQAAFNVTVASIINSDEDKTELLSKAANEYAEIIGSLDAFFDAFIEGGEEIVAKAAGDDTEAQEALAKWVEDYGEFVNSEGKAEAPAALAKSADASAVTIDYTKIGKEMSGLVSKALEPVQQQLEAVTDTVEALATRSPTKKAADPADSGSAKTRKLAKKGTSDEPTEQELHFAKSVFG